MVRSQVSSLWGGSGGGLIAIDTLAPTAEPVYGARVLFGSDHLSRYALTATGTAGGNGYVLGLARTRASGYRDHARAEQTALLAKLERELESGTQLQAIFSSVSLAGGPGSGGLNAAEVDADRSAGRAEQPALRHGRRRRPVQALAPPAPAARVRTTTCNAMVYGLVRDFKNWLPFRQVAFDRGAGGAALSWSSWAGPLRWTTGVDFDVQMDHRKNWDNLPGGARARSCSTRARRCAPSARGRAPSSSWAAAST